MISRGRNETDQRQDRNQDREGVLNNIGDKPRRRHVARFRDRADPLTRHEPGPIPDCADLAGILIHGALQAPFEVRDLRRSGRNHMGDFWANAWPSVRQLRRPALRGSEPTHPRRTKLARHSLGIHACSFAKLAPAHIDVAHAGLPALRTPAWMASFCQCVAAQRRGGFAVSCASANDGRALAERIRRGRFRDPSVACRISRVDRGAQRCAQRSFLYAHASRLCSICS